MTPEAKLDNESLRARPTASPAAPTMVRNEVVLMPSYPAAEIMTRTKSTLFLLRTALSNL